MKKIISFLMNLTLLTGCCFAGHGQFVRDLNSGIGSVNGVFRSGKTREEFIKYYEKSISVPYKGRMVYVDRKPEKISFDGKELSTTGSYCDFATLFDTENFKKVDWKYLKGSNPETCVLACPAW
jgi:outer membrane lipoprotein-sorting protein